MSLKDHHFIYDECDESQKKKEEYFPYAIPFLDQSFQKLKKINPIEGFIAMGVTIRNALEVLTYYFSVFDEGLLTQLSCIFILNQYIGNLIWFLLIAESFYVPTGNFVGEGLIMQKCWKGGMEGSCIGVYKNIFISEFLLDYRRGIRR